ncbi:phage portal protein [Methylocella sp.]|uniref:phage portal protein n=1 Tax=Methylocella sp. TaxID=1978226 RepID=UPI0035B20B58
MAAGLAGRATLARRAQYLVANNGHAAAGVAAWTSALAGAGIKPQSRAADPQARKAVNAAFTSWTDAADAAGVLDFYGIQALIARSLVVAGEAFVILSHDETGALRLRVLDAGQVDGSYHADLQGGAHIVAGIEFDAAGRRAAYHMWRDPPGLPLGGSVELLRVPAEDVCHIYRLDAPGMVRGVSWFAPVLLRLADLDTAHGAQLVRQQIAALLTGFVVDPNGNAAGYAGAPDGQGGVEPSLEPGEMKVLRPGEDVRFSEPAQIGAEAIDFLKITAREIAAGLGIPYEQLTGDLSGVNYSSIRAGLVEFRRRAEMLQLATIIHQFCRPVWRRWLAAEILAGRIHAPGFERDPESWLAVDWLPPKNDWVDPLKDAQAEILAIDAGLMSRRQAVAARGYDLEALDAEIAADAAAAEALGLSFAKPADPAAEVK